MIISRIDGGLGNQLFQYALGRHLAEKYDTELKFDLSFFNQQGDRSYELHNFCMDFSVATQEECLLLRFRKPTAFTKLTWALLQQKSYPLVPANSFCRERKLNTYDSRVLHKGPNMYLDGLWQTEKYFTPISDIIRQEVQLRFSGPTPYHALADTIRRTSSVCIHVRRGDYLNHSVFAACTPVYYQRAIDYISSVITSPIFFVFSNDIPWCMEHLPVPPSSVFVGSETPLPPHEDLMLMSLCRHNITANSTFSWWGAWLNRNPDKVVCTPSQWHRNGRQIHDTLPEQWIKIDL